MTPAQSESILERMIARYGIPSPALEYRSLYQLVVAVVLSAQTTDSQVNAVTPSLFRRFHDFQSLAGADIAEVETIIKSTGFYRNKAKNITLLARDIVHNHGGTVPENREELMRLPGVGRKSANVILAMGFNIPAFAVDTHVLRVANRIGYCATDDPLKVETSLTSIIPETMWIPGHLLFITHGRRTCRARNPLCPECAINDLCAFVGKTL